MPHSDQSSSPTSSRRAPIRILDFSKGQSRLGKSPLGVVRASSYPPRSQQIKGKGKDKAARARPDEAADFSDHRSDFLQDANGDLHFTESHGDPRENFENQGTVLTLEDQDLVNEQTDNGVGGRDSDDISPSIAAKSAGRGRKRKNALTKLNNNSITSSQKPKGDQHSRNDNASATTSHSAKRPGRKPKDRQAEIDAENARQEAAFERLWGGRR